MAKAVLARGVSNIPTSYKLWIAAARLEADDAAKSRVLRRALERIPGSVRCDNVTASASEATNYSCFWHINIYLAAIARMLVLNCT
jgi:hypothetical protein